MTTLETPVESTTPTGLLHDWAAETWNRSREHFQWVHPAGAALVGAILQAVRQDVATAAGDLRDAAVGAGVAVVAYAVLMLAVNAVISLRTIYQRRGERILALQADLASLRNTRVTLALRVEVDSNAYHVCGVVATNTSDVLSIADCSAVAESITPVSWDEAKIGDSATTLKQLQGIPLKLVNDVDKPPRRTSLLGGGSHLTFIAAKTHPTGNLFIDHAVWTRYRVQDDPREHWHHVIPAALPPGEYQIVVKVEGRDIKPERITLRVWSGRGEARAEVVAAVP